MTGQPHWLFLVDRSLRERRPKTLFARDVRVYPSPDEVRGAVAGGCVSASHNRLSLARSWSTRARCAASAGCRRTCTVCSATWRTVATTSTRHTTAPPSATTRAWRSRCVPPWRPRHAALTPALPAASAATCVRSARPHGSATTAGTTRCCTTSRRPGLGRSARTATTTPVCTRRGGHGSRTLQSTWRWCRGASTARRASTVPCASATPASSTLCVTGGSTGRAASALSLAHPPHTHTVAAPAPCRGLPHAHRRGCGVLHVQGPARGVAV